MMIFWGMEVRSLIPLGIKFREKSTLTELGNLRISSTELWWQRHLNMLNMNAWSLMDLFQMYISMTKTVPSWWLLIKSMDKYHLYMLLRKFSFHLLRKLILSRSSLCKEVQNLLEELLNSLIKISIPHFMY